MTFDFRMYQNVSRDRMINALMVADYGTVTEKLMNWHNKGADNPVWKTGPAISAGANRPETILEEVPYAIRLSEHSSTLISKLTEEVNVNPKKGGKRLDFEEKTSEELLAALIIPVQFAILEYFEFEIYKSKLINGGIYLIDNQGITLKDIKETGIESITAGRIEHQCRQYQREPIKKRIEGWQRMGVDPLSNEMVAKYLLLAERRNTLVHEVHFKHPTLIEAIEYFNQCTCVASEINKHLND